MLPRRTFLAWLASIAALMVAPRQAAPPVRWREGEAIPDRYRPEIERRLRADGLRDGAIMTAAHLERVWPKAQWRRDTGQV